MNIREKTIDKIIEHIKTAVIKYVEIDDEYWYLYDNALHPFYEYHIRNKENCFFPTYEKIRENLNLSRTSEIYFSKIEGI